MLKGLVVGELHKSFWFDGLQWGRLIQLSPDYVELLQDPRGSDVADLLHPFHDPELNFLETARLNDSIAWLESLPTPPLDLIGVLQFHLTGLSAFGRAKYFAAPPKSERFPGGKGEMFKDLPFLYP